MKAGGVRALSPAAVLESTIAAELVRIGPEARAAVEALAVKPALAPAPAGEVCEACERTGDCAGCGGDGCAICDNTGTCPNCKGYGVVRAEGGR